VVTPFYGACLNPAIALGITLTAVFGHPASTWKYIWLYPVMPFVGAILAVLFYEFVYKKTQLMLNSTHADEEADFEEKGETYGGPVDSGVLDD